MPSNELVLFRGSSSQSKSVGLIGMTAILGSHAAPTIAPYAKELFYRLLIAILERMFRSFESLAIKYLRLDEEAQAVPSAKDQHESPKPKTVEMLEEKRAASGFPPCPFGSPDHITSMPERGPRALVRHWREKRNAHMNAIESYDPPAYMRMACLSP
ncbi:MAG: hypothetical protein M1822_000227 [Bathelium mastoideum]|nr:MAG: hypothetical protein M1822_000227 [Bathelium mastoideum]